MAVYSPSQLTQYLNHISHPPVPTSAPRDLSLLSSLQTRQLCTIPFESLSLHYSPTRQISLSPRALFAKMVTNPAGRRGGYCMENNALFGCVLRGLGYEVLSVGGRVSHETTGRRDGGWDGWNHMLNLVRVEGRRYLVDVGFGGDGPCRPILLERRGEGGIVYGGLAPQEMRLEWKSLPKHTDPEQRVWVYSHRENQSARWVEAYCFTEVEFFAEDFAIMNLATMTLRESYFLQTVLAQRFMLEEVVEEGDLEDQANGGQGTSGGTNDGGNRPRAVGVMILHKNLVKRRMADKVEVLAVLDNETDRAAALKKYFKIELGEEELRAIRDLPTELRGDGGRAGGENTDQMQWCQDD